MAKVKVENKGIELNLNDIDEVETYLKMNGYGMVFHTGNGIYQVERLGAELPAITIVGGETYE